MPLIDWNKSLRSNLSWMTRFLWHLRCLNSVCLGGALWLGKWLALIELCLLTTKNHKSTSNREEWFDIFAHFHYTLPATRRQIIDSQTVSSSVRPVTATTVTSLDRNLKNCFKLKILTFEHTKMTYPWAGARSRTSTATARSKSAARGRNRLWVRSVSNAASARKVAILVAASLKYI